jgi:hypothetical protein
MQSLGKLKVRSFRNTRQVKLGGGALNLKFFGGESRKNQSNTHNRGFIPLPRVKKAMLIGAK